MFIAAADAEAKKILERPWRGKRTKMKICKNCGNEINTRDGENLCRPCEDCEGDKAELKRRRANAHRRANDQAMRDCGLVKVRGELGGTYWE